MSLNVELLERIKAHILEEPKRYDQNMFGYKQDPADGGPPCGTVACIAGWAVVLSGEELFRSFAGIFLPRSDAETLAYELTGIPEGDEDIGVVFSSGAYWPPKFRKRLLAAKTQTERAQVAADYIDFIIATKGDAE